MSNDARVEQTTDGWTIRLMGAIVTQLLVDHRFSMRLDGGTQIVLEEPFTLSPSLTD